MPKTTTTPLTTGGLRVTIDYLPAEVAALGLHMDITHDMPNFARDATKVPLSPPDETFGMDEGGERGKERHPDAKMPPERPTAFVLCAADCTHLRTVHSRETGRCLVPGCACQGEEVRA